MSTWLIRDLTRPDVLAEGTQADLHGAWAAAIDTALALIGEGALKGCRMVVDDQLALLIPGHDDDGALNVPATRAAAERAAAACCGVPL